MPSLRVRIGPQHGLIALFLAAAIAAFVGYHTLPEPSRTISYLAMSAMALLAIAAGVRLHRPRAILPWALLAAGQASFLVADGLWYAEYLPTETTPAIPSLPDLFYLAGYPLLALGVVAFIRARQPRYRLTAAIDAMIVGVAGVLILWLVAIEGFIHDETVALDERLVLLAYAVGDVLILAAAAYLLLSGRQPKGAFYLLVASMISLLAADTVYAVVADEVLASTLSDVLFLVSYVFFGLTALVRSMRNLTEPSDAPTAPESSGRLVLLAAAISVLPVFALYQHYFLDHQDVPVLVAAGVAVMVGILVRLRELTAVHRRAESRYASLLANASDSFAIVRPDGKFAYASPASERVLGYTSEEMVGRSALEFVHSRAVPEAIRMLRRVSARPQAQREAELRVQRKDGEWRWLSVTATNRTDDPIVKRCRSQLPRRHGAARGCTAPGFAGTRPG